MANVVTVVGAQLTVVAVPAQIYTLTGSSAWVGLTGLFGLIPLIVFGLWGGALADHFDRRTVLIITTAGLIATSALFCLLALQPHTDVWLLLVVYALQQAWLSRSQRPPVIVFLVDGGESRLQELRRKVRELDARFGLRLPVWFARTDQLRVGRSSALHPLRRVWRTAHASDLVCPFEGEPDDDPSA